MNNDNIFTEESYQKYLNKRPKLHQQERIRPEGQSFFDAMLEVVDTPEMNKIKEMIKNV